MLENCSKKHTFIDDSFDIVERQSFALSLNKIKGIINESNLLSYIWFPKLLMITVTFYRRMNEIL